MRERFGGSERDEIYTVGTAVLLLFKKKKNSPPSMFEDTV